MLQNQVIVKLVHACNTDASISPEIGRITGLIDAENFYKLMNVLDVGSNPRKPKESNVTKEITDTLETNSQLFHFMSKGILISVSDCMVLDRNRFRLNFAATEYAVPGVLDGGHNTYAIAKYLLKYVATDDVIRSIKDWDTLVDAWKEHANKLEILFEAVKHQSHADAKSLPDESAEFKFLIPVEIIYPRATDDQAVLDKWGQSHRDITHSRNNNVQLTDATKDNHQGFYDYLKSLLHKELNEKIEWKTNDGGVIKASDVIALSLIPISRLPLTDIGSDINAVKIYNSKQYCVETFRNIMEREGNGVLQGQTFQLTNSAIKSALGLVPIILKTYDLMYCKFPDAYNKASGKFGRIEGVRIYDEKITNDPKYSKKPFKSKFFGFNSNYQYADGFILPLIVGLSELIVYDEKSKTVSFTHDPEQFVVDHLEKVLSRYATVIRFANYDPQKIGKDRGTYQMASDAIRSALSD